MSGFLLWKHLKYLFFFYNLKSENHLDTLNYIVCLKENFKGFILNNYSCFRNLCQMSLKWQVQLEDKS